MHLKALIDIGLLGINRGVCNVYFYIPVPHTQTMDENNIHYYFNYNKYYETKLS